MADLLKIIGARIRAKRKDKGLSQEKLAELANLNASYVGKIERGEKNITFKSLESVSNALDSSIEELLLYAQPLQEAQTTYTLISIINLLQDKDLDEQKKALDLLKLVLNWNK